MHARLFHLHTLSALHCGTGQSAGVVDLPIARARATKLPIVPGSSLRGVLREQVTASDRKAARELFGPASITGDQETFAGALSIADAHLLLLPVRCLAGIVSYVTSPFILRRYARDCRRAGVSLPALPQVPSENEALVPTDSVNLVDKKLVLEDLDLSVRNGGEKLKEWSDVFKKVVYPDRGDDEDGKDLARRIAILPDSIMSFLAETATEIRSRIAIDHETGTVRTGALWYEENLPAEAVLWGVYALSASNSSDDPLSMDQLAQSLPSSDTLLQLGGKTGVGRGLVRFLSSEVAA